MMLVAGQFGGVTTEVFHARVAGFDPAACQFERARGSLHRQHFLHFHGEMRKIQSGAKANLNDPSP